MSAFGGKADIVRTCCNLLLTQSDIGASNFPWRTMQLPAW